MDELLYDKLDELLNELDNNKKIIRMKQLKHDIYEDKDLKIKLEEYKKESENPYSSKYIELKRKILDNELIKEYKDLENELYFTILKINQKLNVIIDKDN